VHSHSDAKAVPTPLIKKSVLKAMSKSTAFIIFHNFSMLIPFLFFYAEISQSQQFGRLAGTTGYMVYPSFFEGATLSR
jgi:hypothetical protein